MLKVVSRISAVILCTLLVALLVAGCGSSASPAATTNATTSPVSSPTTASSPTEAGSSVAATPLPQNAPVFRIGLIGQLSGVAAAPVARLFQEFEDMMKYTNDVEGGIDGIRLDWKEADDQNTNDGAVIAYKQLHDNFKPNLYIQVEDFLLAGALQQINADGSNIITTSALMPSLYNPPGRIFSISMATSDGFAAYLNWILSNWKGTGNPKVGVMYWDDTPAGQAWQADQAWAASKHIDLVPEGYSITALDVTAQLTKLRDSGVNYIWVLGMTSNAAVIVQDANSLGISQQIPITFMEDTESEELLNQVGSAAEGFYGYQAHSPYSDGSEGAQLYSKIIKWAENKDVWSDNRQMITVKGLLDALIPKIAPQIKDGTLTNDDIYNALNSLSDINTWGNNQNFSFSPTKRIGMSSMKIFEYTQTGTKSVSGWLTMPRIFEGAAQ